jgi:hypothetical protein
LKNMKNGPEYELLSAYLDGEATAPERAEVEKLLASDPAARALLDEFQAIQESIQNLPPLHLHEDLGQRVLQLAERQMLLEQSPAARADERPTPGSVARSIARHALRPRALIRTALILLVAAGLYLFEVRPPARPARQVAVAPPAERATGPAQAPQLRAAAREEPPRATTDALSDTAISPARKQPAAPGVARAMQLQKAMPAAVQFEGAAVSAAAPASPVPPLAGPRAPSSLVMKDDKGIGGKPNDGQTPSAALGTVSALPGSGAARVAVTVGDRDKGVAFGRAAVENRAAASYGGVAGGQPGPLSFSGVKSGPAGGREQEKAAVSGTLKRSGTGQLSLGQDVMLVKLVVAPQALERHALEQLLGEQQIVAAVAKREPGQLQYVGDAVPEKLVALLKELRLRKADFPSVVEVGKEAGSALQRAAVHGHAASQYPRRPEEIRLDDLGQQRQNGQPVIQQQAQTQLRLAPTDAAKEVPGDRRLRFVLQVTPAELSASSSPVAAPTAAKPALRANPLRRAAVPASNGDRPQ